MGSRLRRSAGAFVALGLSVLASSTVALAQDPAPTPTPTPTPVPTVTVAPSPVATATATAALTPEPTITAAPTATATAAVTATATTAPPQDVQQRPRTPVRQAATPTPTPTATADPGEAGATITICHANGDGTYETVAVTLFSGVLDEHFDHPDDIIPAPATGCGPGAQPDALVGVCHATGDPERPYEFAGFLDPSNLEGHENHAGDLIPAPNGTCPGLDEYFVPTPVPTEEPTPEPTATASPTQTATVEPTPTSTPDDGDEEGEGDGGGGTSPSGGTAGYSGQSAATTSAAYLPFTGFELWLIAAAGLGLTLMGGGLRLLAAQPVGVTR